MRKTARLALFGQRARVCVRESDELELQVCCYRVRVVVVVQRLDCNGRAKPETEAFD